MTVAIANTAHCKRCNIERPVTLEQVRVHGLGIMRCPACAAQMAWGPLPPDPPDQNRIGKLERSLADVTQRLAKVDPAPILAAREGEIAELQARIDLAASVPGVVLSDLDGDPVRAVAKHREQVQRARQECQELAETKAILERELGPLREAARFHDRAALQERLSSPLPGDREARRVATELDKFTRARNEEIMARRRECDRLGVPFPGYRELSAQLAFHLGGLPVVREGRGGLAQR